MDQNYVSTVRSAQIHMRKCHALYVEKQEQMQLCKKRLDEANSVYARAQKQILRARQILVSSESLLLESKRRMEAATVEMSECESELATASLNRSASLVFLQHNVEGTKGLKTEQFESRTAEQIVPEKENDKYRTAIHNLGRKMLSRAMHKNKPESEPKEAFERDIRAFTSEHNLKLTFKSSFVPISTPSSARFFPLVASTKFSS